MGDDGAHIRLKLDTRDPIALRDFVAEFVGIGSQFEKFVSRERPELKADSEIYIQEVRHGCIEADLVAWIGPASSGLFAAVGAALNVIDKGQIFSQFVDDVGGKLSKYFKRGGRAQGVGKSDLTDFVKATKAIANDPNGSARLEAAVFEDGERKVRAAFTFSTPEARRAEEEIAEHRKELEATSVDHDRALLRFVRPSVESGKPGKKGGERGIIEAIHNKALPILYASDMAEQRVHYEMMQLDGNVFHVRFDVSLLVEKSASDRPIAYRISDVHAVLNGEPDEDLPGI